MKGYVNKKQSIIEYLEKDVNTPTSIIVNELQVSERHVQRVRKEHKNKMKRKRKLNNKLQKTKERMKGMVNHMKNDKSVTPDKIEIQIISMANESGWSIQDIAIAFGLELNQVRNILNEYHYMITGKVLDENSDTVWFEKQEKIRNENPIEELTENDFDLDKNNESNIPQKFPGFGFGKVKKTKQPLMWDQFKKQETFWEVEIDRVTACSKVKKFVEVFMNKQAKTKAMMYMKWAGAREWLAYLIGEVKDDVYHVNDLYLPDQRTSSVLVDKVNNEEFNKLSIIGVIHSHHEMGAGDENNPSFSGHDNAFINSNHNLSLLAGRNRKTGGFNIVGIARVKTPCGGLITVKAKVKPKKEKPTDEEKQLKNEFFLKTMSDNTQQIIDGKVDDKPIEYLSKTTNPVSVTTTHGKRYHFSNNGDAYPYNQIEKK